MDSNVRVDLINKSNSDFDSVVISIAWESDSLLNQRRTLVPQPWIAHAKVSELRALSDTTFSLDVGNSLGQKATILVFTFLSGGKSGTGKGITTNLESYYAVFVDPDTQSVLINGF